MYYLWCRRRIEGSEWTQMPYACRTFDACEELVDWYESEWGNCYQYRIVPAAVTAVA